MLAGGIKSFETLDELESHLREDVERQMHVGMDASRAFEIAVGRIGQPRALNKEFMKTDGRKLALLRRLKMLIFGTQGIPIPPLEDFGPIAQEVLELAAGESRHFHHDFVGTEHVLLALTKSNSAIVANVMKTLGVEAETIRLEVETIVGNWPDREVPRKIPFTPYAKKALQVAAEQARALRQPHIQAEHIFLGLIIVGRGVAAIVLKNLGVRLERVREEILREMRGHPGAA
jgi:hypothetical protein